MKLIDFFPQSLSAQMNEVGCAQKLYAGTTSEHIPNWTISVLKNLRERMPRKVRKKAQNDGLFVLNSLITEVNHIKLRRKSIIVL